MLKKSAEVTFKLLTCNWFNLYNFFVMDLRTHLCGLCIIYIKDILCEVTTLILLKLFDTIKSVCWLLEEGWAN